MVFINDPSYLHVPTCKNGGAYWNVRVWFRRPPQSPVCRFSYPRRSKVVCREFGKVVCFIFVNCLLYDSISNKSLKCLDVFTELSPQKRCWPVYTILGGICWWKFTQSSHNEISSMVIEIQNKIPKGMRLTGFAFCVSPPFPLAKLFAFGLTASNISLAFRSDKKHCKSALLIHVYDIHIKLPWKV